MDLALQITIGGNVKEIHLKNALSLVPLYFIAGLFFLLGVAILVPLFKLKGSIQPETVKSASN